MAKTDFQNVDEYLATMPAPLKRALTEVRRTIRGAVPDADEVISYQIPAYKLNGRFVLYFAGFKAHFSLSCPPPFTVFDAFKKQLVPYEVSKSAIRFPLDQPVPTKLVSAIAKFRADEARAFVAKKSKRAGTSKPALIKRAGTLKPKVKVK